MSENNNIIRYCLNCNAQLSDKSITEYGLFCDSLCRHGYSTRQYREWQKIIQKGIQAENESRKELTERYTND